MNLSIFFTLKGNNSRARDLPLVVACKFKAGKRKYNQATNPGLGGQFAVPLTLAILIVTICSNVFCEPDNENDKREPRNKEHSSYQSPPSPANITILVASALPPQLAATESNSTIDSGADDENRSATEQTKQQPLELCDSNTEFWCQLDNRCVPIEWRCDFTEQCLDGEDELGCAPEWCNFEHGLCNWHNDPTTELGCLNVFPGIWRRYFNSNTPSLSALSSSITPQRAPSSRESKSLHGVSPFASSESTLTSTSALKETLEFLGSNVRQSSRFIYAPLTLNTPTTRTTLARVNSSPHVSSSSSSSSSSSVAAPTLSGGKGTVHQKAAPLNLQEAASQRNGDDSATEPHKANSDFNATVSAHLKSPTISQTGSMCQIRFKYALWTGPTVNKHDNVRLKLSLIASQRSLGSLGAPITPSEAHYNGGGSHSSGAGAAKRPLPNIPNSGSRVQVLWSRSIESPLVVLDSLSGTANSGTAGAREKIEWLLGVAELGHLRQIELDFEAEANLVSAAPAAPEMGARFKWKVAGGSGGPQVQGKPAATESRQQQQERRRLAAGRYDSLVALDWVKFQGCSWPGQLHLREHQTRKLLSQRYDQSSGPASTFGWLASAEELADELAGPSEHRRKHNLVSGCERQRDFHCSTKNICLDERRLCNFVNDCMNEEREFVVGQADSDGQESAHNINDSDTGEHQVAAEGDITNASLGAQWSGSTAAVGGEDELPDLCGAVPGMESFERFQERTTKLDAGVAREFTANNDSDHRNKPRQQQPPQYDGGRQVSKFWSLSGNWPRDRIRLGRSGAANSQAEQQGRATHLPLRDHTLGTNTGGHYLSFEISEMTERLGANYNEGKSAEAATKGSHYNSGNNSNNKGKNNGKSSVIYWIYLNSPWMEKLNEEAGDCRAKFFYNIVTGKQSFSLDEQSHNLPHKIYISVEHFIRPDLQLRDSTSPTATAAEVSVGGTNEHGANYNRQVNSFTFSHLVDCDNLTVKPTESCGSIEYPGLDFWREINVKLANLAEGDLFYVRIAIFVELEVAHKWDTNWRTTINIDDLSTHFGCALFEDEQIDSKTTNNSRTKQYQHINSFSLAEFIKRESVQNYIRYSPLRKRKVSTIDDGSHDYEAHRVIVYVFGVLFIIVGIILAIVFILVPYVERIAINYHDQLSVGLSEVMRSSQVGDANNNTNALSTMSTISNGNNTRNRSINGTSRSLNNTMETCELTTESDWERISRQWRQSAISESFMTDSVATMLDSQSYPQRIDSLNPLCLSIDNQTSITTYDLSSSGIVDGITDSNSDNRNETMSRTSRQPKVHGSTNDNDETYIH